jgi:tetratricopeptide (TPR) repeat protein
VNKWKIPLAAVLIVSAAMYLSFVSSGQQIDAKQAGQALRSGVDMFGKREYEEAIETLRQVPQGSSHEARAKYYEGSAQLMLRNLDAAVDALQQALLLAPEDAEILYALGVASFKLGNIKLAKGYFASVLDIEATNERERELHKQAKGLMNTMASVERRQDEGQTVVPPVHGAGVREPAPPEATDSPREGD